MSKISYRFQINNKYNFKSNELLITVIDYQDCAQLVRPGVTQLFKLHLENNYFRFSICLLTNTIIFRLLVETITFRLLAETKFINNQKRWMDRTNNQLFV